LYSINGILFIQDSVTYVGRSSSGTKLGKFRGIFGGKSAKVHSPVSRTSTTLPHVNEKGPASACNNEGEHSDDDDDEDEEEV